MIMMRWPSIEFVPAAALLSLLLIGALMCVGDAQRPFFAGSRPPNGLSQKEKYIVQSMAAAAAATTNNTISAPLDGSISSRFAELDVDGNNGSGGLLARPPIGLPVVVPEQMYVSLPPLRRVHIDTMSIAARFDDTNAAVAPHQRQPIDARGDQLLLDQIGRLPEGQRPFWFVNANAIEALRNGTNANVGNAAAARNSFVG